MGVKEAVSGNKKLRILKYLDSLSNSSDGCGRKPYPGTKNCGFKNIWIRCGIRRMDVDGSRMWVEQVGDSKISGYVWTGPKGPGNDLFNYYFYLCYIKIPKMNSAHQGSLISGNRH